MVWINWVEMEKRSTNMSMATKTSMHKYRLQKFLRASSSLLVLFSPWWPCSSLLYRLTPSRVKYTDGNHRDQRLRQSLGLLSRSDLGSKKDKPGLKEGRGQTTNAPIPPEEVPAGVVAFVVVVVVVSPGTASEEMHGMTIIAIRAQTWV